jgi:hypothetical protein
MAFLLISLGHFVGCGPLEPAVVDLYRNIADEFSHLEEASSRLNYHTMIVNTGARNVLPAYTILYDDLLQVPDAGSSLCNALLSSCHRPETLLYHSFRMLGVPAGGFGPPLTGTGIQTPSPDFSFRDGGEKSWEMLPWQLKSGIMEALQGWMHAEDILREFLAPLGNDRNRESLMEPWRDRELDNFEAIDLIVKADLRKLSYASGLMASSLVTLTHLEGLEVSESFELCVLETQMGTMGIFGSQRDTLKGGYDMIIDLGGNDLYEGNIASPQDGNSPIVVVIDFAGDDSYIAGGAYLVNGCLGIGMLFDLSGNDCYISESAGIATSCYGTSLLFDQRGDDLYQSKSAFSQGAAHVGSALLIDIEGDDEYYSSGNSQGYGGTLGVGLLLDLAGSDRYNQKHKPSSFVQGAGCGRWAEASDGHSLGGGLGIFIEAGGDDHYFAESFSQGASYFTGVGLFFDLGGDDFYNALSHSQGYAAHYGLSGFFEMKGDDHYNAGSDFRKITQVLGGGRDLSAAWFIDEQGDDTYHFGNRSAGIGDLNGVGILWDRKGDDSYIWHQNSVNAGSPSLGQTIKQSEGMSLGARISSFPVDQDLGTFRDDDQYEVITMNNR